MKIILMPFGQKHLESSRRWMNDREICRLFNRVYRPVSAVEQKKWFKAAKKDLTQLIFAIEVDKVYIGNVGLKFINQLDRKAEFYIFIGEKKYWGQGIGTAATKQFLAFAKKKLNLHKLYLHVTSDNLPAMKLYKKFGFTEEGVLKDEIRRENKYKTMIRMAYFLN